MQGWDVLGFHAPAWRIWFGCAAAVAALATFSMRTMIPLGVTGIFANILNVTYAFFGGFYPVLVLQVILLLAIFAAFTAVSENPTAKAGPQGDGGSKRGLGLIRKGASSVAG
jgi:hypothetical protein